MTFWFPFLMLVLRETFNTVSNGFVKTYQKSAPKGNVSFCMYSMIMSVFAMGFYFITGGFRVEMNLLTLGYALATGIDMVILVILGIFAMQYVDLLTLNLAQACGGMIIPVLFGILFLEERTVFTFWISAVFMVLAVLLPILMQKGKRERGTVIGYILCSILFFCNGLYTILNKLYQANPATCNESSFCFMLNVVMLVMSVVALPVLLRRTPSERAVLHQLSPKHILFILLGAVTSNAASLLNFSAMSGMHLSLMTILGTSLGILGTAFLSFTVFRERKLGIIDFLSILCAIASVVIGAI